MRRTVRAATWLLWVQLASTVAALVLAGVAMMSSTTVRSATPGVTVVGGALVSTPVIVCGVLLVAAAVLGLVALRRRSRYLRAGVVLFAPLGLAVVTSVSALPEDDAGSQDLATFGIWPSIQKTLLLLEWSSWLVLAAMVVAAASALLLLRLRHHSLPISPE